MISLSRGLQYLILETISITGHPVFLLHLCNSSIISVDFFASCNQGPQKAIGPKELTQTEAELLDIANAQTWLAWCCSLVCNVWICSMRCSVFNGCEAGSASHKILIAVW